MLIWLSVVGVGVVAFLCWKLFRSVAVSQIETLLEKRRASSRMVGSGEFVDGNRHLKVALALTSSQLFYENADMEASLDLQWVREIEYDTSLATGGAAPGGEVLRIRCFSQVFEFVVPGVDIARWQLMLPAQRWKEAPAAAGFAAPVAIAR